MKETKERNTKNCGVTLVALTITIIVMLVLVAVTITVAVNGGLFEYAGRAGTKTNEAIALEQEMGTGRMNIANVWYDSPQGYADNKPSANQGPDKVYLGMTNEEIDSGIGYYVYVDGQYGVIYADLAYSRLNSKWSGSNGAYSYTAENHDNLKKYYLNGTYDPDEAEKGWDEKPLLVEDENINKVERRTINRFYVMALTDFTKEEYTTFCWNKNNNGKTFATENTFKSGLDNTYKLINTKLVKWTDQDIWKNLTDIEGWFVPSRAEWSAFAQELGITSSKRSKLRT